MSDSEEGKLGYAGGGEDVGAKLTDEDRKVLEAFHKMKVKPDVESKQELEEFVRRQRQRGLEHHLGDSVPTASPRLEPASSASSYPKLSYFFGEGKKGDVSWETFKFEVASVQCSGSFNRAQILFGVRRAVKGEASDIVRRLGTAATLEEVMATLEGMYGHIDSQETVMRKFYSCTQQQKESVSAYASRLEEIFSQACDLGALKRTDSDILKRVLYQGLRKEIKQMSIYQFRTTMEYDKFKIELRQIEAEVNGDGERKPCAPVVPPQPEKTELGEMKSLLTQLNDKITKLEQGQAELKAANTRGRGVYQSGWSNRGGPQNRGGSQNRGRGRGDYKPTRPNAGNTFQPSCYNCSEKGHLSRNCPYKDKRECFKCHAVGHLSKNCPN